MSTHPRSLEALQAYAARRKAEIRAYKFGTCAICPEPLGKEGAMFCSRQCAGKVRQRLNKTTEADRKTNKYWAARWAAFKPQFDAWKAKYGG